MDGGAQWAQSMGSQKKKKEKKRIISNYAEQGALKGGPWGKIPG